MTRSLSRALFSLSSFKKPRRLHERRKKRAQSRPLCMLQEKRAGSSRGWLQQDVIYTDARERRLLIFELRARDKGSCCSGGRKKTQALEERGPSRIHTHTHTEGRERCGTVQHPPLRPRVYIIVFPLSLQPMRPHSSSFLACTYYIIHARLAR